jgi:hypothetical protein
MVSAVGVARLQEYGMESLQVLVEPVPVAATVLLSSKLSAPVVETSCTRTSILQVKFVRLVVLTVIVTVTLTVPVTVVAGGVKHCLEPQEPWLARKLEWPQ